MIKRLLDIIASIFLLLILSPLLLVLAVTLFIFQGSPIFLIQQRAGLKGHPFNMYKFRTMTDSKDEKGQLLPDEERTTSIGRLLRSISLDELPELVNVINGRMSLVGPRPLWTRYIGRYSPAQRRRLEVKPGITGWAQVNGRNAISWEERFALDVWYVDHQSLRLDIKVIIMTMWKVLKREGISPTNQITMPEFFNKD